jgi:glyoxylase-like metal-dependent hydrolase (beta-lactamase superfamily II)
MADVYRLSRRIFLTDLGRSVFAIAILGTGIAACTTRSDSNGGSTTSSTGGTDPTTTTGGASDGTAAVARVNLGNVSAYVVTRGTEAAIVDTGNPGDHGDIEEALSEIGLGWANVGTVILTHRHPDHIGSLGPVMESATQADGYAGEADIPQISSPRPLTAVGDGDSVFGLEVFETPGHTAGSISVLDSAAGALIVGDAMNGMGSGVSGSEGGVGGANPRFSDDMAQAAQSIKKLAALSFDSVYFGHGVPVEGGAGPLVADLAATL